MLKHTKGNLIDLAEQGEFDVIVHGCNCQNTMGSGIAKEIKERYPLAYRADSNMHSRTQFPVQLLGNYSLHVGFLGRKSGSPERHFLRRTRNDSGRSSRMGRLNPMATWR